MQISWQFRLAKIFKRADRLNVENNISTFELSISLLYFPPLHFFFFYFHSSFSYPLDTLSCRSLGQVDLNLNPVTFSL